jgi:hypothetical protein
MAILLASSILMLGIVSLRGQPVRGGGGSSPTTSLNGDVNCDGQRNITDAVVLLRYLFAGGPEPCAVAQEAAPCCADVVAKLDQVLASLNDPCKDPMNRMVDNGNGTVTDLCSGLMWQKAIASQDLDQDGTAEAQFNSNQSLFIAQQSRVGGFSDWRLPSFKEFEVLYRVTSDRPYLQGQIPEFDFFFADGGRYWLSQTVGTDDRLTAAPTPTRLDHAPNNQVTKNRVLLVRGG